MPVWTSFVFVCDVRDSGTMSARPDTSDVGNRLLPV